VLNIREIPIGSHERVIRATDDTTGLDAIVAIHNTKLGPALGGCRYLKYDSYDEQRLDALRLSKGMTYKNALAGLHFGGGKSTINANTAKSPDLWRSFAEVLNYTAGTYYGAGDVGTVVDDLDEMHKHTQYVLGFGGQDSGWSTAYGLYNALKGLLKVLDDAPNVNWTDKTFSVVGLGKVGSRLINFLSEHPVKVYATDIRKAAFKNLKTALEHLNTHPDFELEWVETDTDIHDIATDVYMPCALGGTVTPDFIKTFKSKAICGGANNQLGTTDHGKILHEEGILYVPDYLANAGGVIFISASSNVTHDITTTLDIEWNDPMVKPKLMALHEKAYDILKISQEEDKPTTKVAKEMVEKKLKGL
jgi:glutamate dehydrogenase/leucine dehydrogenase